MSTALDALIEAFPEDTAAFFAEGMNEMERLNSAPVVRAIMCQYSYR